MSSKLSLYEMVRTSEVKWSFQATDKFARIDEKSSCLRGAWRYHGLQSASSSCFSPLPFREYDGTSSLTKELRLMKGCQGSNTFNSRMFVLLSTTTTRNALHALRATQTSRPSDVAPFSLRQRNPLDPIAGPKPKQITPQ